MRARNLRMSCQQRSVVHTLSACILTLERQHACYDRGRRALNCGRLTKISVLRTCAQEQIPVTRAFVRAGAVPSMTMKSIPTACPTHQPSSSMLFLNVLQRGISI